MHACMPRRPTLEPSAGPMGGAGFAFPAVNASLILPVTVVQHSHQDKAPSLHSSYPLLPSS